MATIQVKFNLDLVESLIDPDRIEISRSGFVDSRELLLETLASVGRSNTNDSPGIRLDATFRGAWQHPSSWYYTSGNNLATHLSVFDPNEGGQQEALCLWIADVLEPGCAFLSPSVTPAVGNKGPRELCDVLLTSGEHTFVIESKSLSVLGRSVLPSRSDLRMDVEKHIRKAIKQVTGAAKYLKLDYPVQNSSGEIVDLNRNVPFHLVILIPDLSLLNTSEGFGAEFIAEHITKTHCYVHILDPSQLLRAVQAAAMIARRSSLSPVGALDLHLSKRVEVALQRDTPDIDFLVRFGVDAQGMPSASERP
ncbi:hypothetical protein TTY48_34530 [Tsukamurella sp. TY48]|uniref:hypothetical protein n=1 Tax=Tsukamurella TaxID=2060 RepID=UPI001C7CF986|nr:hypothetical protein [Tsukamurella sp. TY48]GIZ98841.1 hypothetical protein TTY48_34530 [Tsukamurella sp. TY48]